MKIKRALLSVWNKDGIVELGQADSPGGEAVEIRGLDLAAVAPDVAEAHVVGHHDNDVGAPWRALDVGG